MTQTFSLPEAVLRILDTLESASYEAYVVGGPVRDLLLGKTPRDWDITTNARPEEVQKLFPESFYENEFGTVSVKVPRFLPATPEEREYDIVEVTTYRSESGYADKRRPQSVTFETELSKDLSRRDFTINALAYGKKDGTWQIIDPCGGQDDLRQKMVRAVGNPEERFDEDALRLMRAVRFTAELRTPEKDFTKSDWQIEKNTLAALKTHAENLAKISMERVRDELSKIILSESPAFGIELLEETGLLHFVLPELEEGLGMGQNLHHIYTVWEHNIRALDTCPSKKLSVRLAALLHDVGKPRTKRGEGYHSTFYNHDHVGARIAKKMLERLKYPKDLVTKATLLVDQHLFYYNVDEVTEASVRRLIKRVGLENMDDLMAVRIGDRLGSGVPKAKPYKLRHLEYMIEKVSKDPLSVKMLKINGADLMEKLSLKPGPTIGAILDVLLAEVIEEPKKNTPELLLERARELSIMPLAELRELAKERISEEAAKKDKAIKDKYWVK